MLLLLIGCRQPLALKPGECVEMRLAERDKLVKAQGYEAIATRTAVHYTTAPDLQIIFVDQDAGPVRDATIQINQLIAKTDSAGRAYMNAFAPNAGIFDIQVTTTNRPCINLRSVRFGSGDIVSIHLESP